MTAPKPRLTQAHLFFFMLLFLVCFFVFKILQPYLNPIILAIIFASVLSPLHQRIERYFKHRKNAAALATCTLMVILILVPLILTSIALIQQGIQTFSNIQDWLARGNLEKLLQRPVVKKILEMIQPMIPDFETGIHVDKSLINISSSLGKVLLDQGGFILGNIVSFLAKSFLMLFVFFFMIRDGRIILSGILHLIPLASSQEEQIIKRIKDVSRSVLLGTFVTALSQGAAGGLALWIAGLPGLFWGTIMAFSSLIPVVGTSLIWVPAAGYLFLTGKTGYGIFVLIWCMVIVGSIDSFLRPLFMKGSAGMSPLVILFAILGGMNYFGLLGILYGPLIFGIAMVLFYIYELEFKTFLDQQDRS